MATFTVTNLNDSGPGSLRAAITAANASGAHVAIDFTVGGTIALASDLPMLANQVKLDATSAPRYASGGPPVVELDCNRHAGLVFGTGSDGSQLLGLAVCNAAGNGVTLNAGSITLDNNYIGLDSAGAAFGNSGDGVYVSAGSSNNLIGLNPSGASGVVANVISGNAGNGLSFHGSSGNTVVANRIGTDPSGTSAIANGGNGIWLTAASHGNEIGGTVYVDSSTGQANDPTGDKGKVTPVFVAPPLGNLVSGNGASGILIDANSKHNTLNGNFVGTTADGTSALGNAADGVWINGADHNSLVGCQFVNNPFVYYNVVSGNGGNGLHVTNSNDVTVQGNFFGVGADNTTIIGNRLDGILVDGSSQNTQVGGVIPLGNVASGNGSNGIEVRDTPSGFTTFNTFGGLLAFKGAAPNGNDGLLITSTGGNNTVRTNVFSGNTNNGIEIAGDASGVTVDPNIVGLNTVGNCVLPNGNNGLQIGGTAHGNVIGGYLPSVIPQNTFSGNNGYGVAILGQAYDNQVFNSSIGLDALGTSALGNLAGGVLVAGTAHNDVIGGSSSDPSMPRTNLISGNAGDGVALETGTSSIHVIGNGIGFDRFGLPVLPNSGAAIEASGAAYVCRCAERSRDGVRRRLRHDRGRHRDQLFESHRGGRGNLEPDLQHRQQRLGVHRRGVRHGAVERRQGRGLRRQRCALRGRACVRGDGFRGRRQQYRLCRAGRHLLPRQRRGRRIALRRRQRFCPGQCRHRCRRRGRGDGVRRLRAHPDQQLVCRL